MKTNIGIYKITSPTGNVYVGQSVDLERRLSEYKRLHCVEQPALYNSLLKHGAENHTFEIIEECEVSELNNREGYWQDTLDSVNNGLNCVRVSSDDRNGYHREDTKLRIKESNIRNRRENGHSWTGRKHTQDTIKKMKDSGSNKKIVLDMSTGIFYDSAMEASEALCIPYYKLQPWLRGLYTNKSNLKYV